MNARIRALSPGAGLGRLGLYPPPVTSAGGGSGLAAAAGLSAAASELARLSDRAMQADAAPASLTAWSLPAFTGVNTGIRLGRPDHDDQHKNAPDHANNKQRSL